jgi:NADH-quinone oxidoreductase subunit J
MTLASILFWAVCALTLTGASICAFARNLFRAALGLGLCLTGVAGLYFFLQAEYLAAIQIVVYVGGVLVLAVFGVMFSRDILGEAQRPRRIHWIGGTVVAAAVLVALHRATLAIVCNAPGVAVVRSDPATNPTAAQVQGLGDLLIGSHLGVLVFAALLLVLVLIGALALVRKDDPQTEAAAENTAGDEA